MICNSMTVVPHGPDAIETWRMGFLFCPPLCGPEFHGGVRTRNPGTNAFRNPQNPYTNNVMTFSADGTATQGGGVYKKCPGSQKQTFHKVDARDLAGDWCTFYLCSIVPWPITPYVWTTKKALDEDRYEEKGRAGILCFPIIPISTETYTRKYVNGHPTNGFVRGRGGLQTGTHWYRDSGCAGSPGGCFVAKKTG